MRPLDRAFVGLLAVMAVVLLAVVLTGCAVVGVAYDAATSVVTRYCAMPPAHRAAAQLLVNGRYYDSGICDTLAADVTLEEALAAAAEAEIGKKLDEVAAEHERQGGKFGAQ